MGCRVAISSTSCWGAPSEQDNEETQEDQGVHGVSSPPSCHATLLQSFSWQETRQLLQGPTATPRMVGREQLAQGEAFSSWLGESTSLLCGHQPWRASPTLPPLHPHPQHWTSWPLCTCATRCPPWVKTSLHAEGATTFLQMLSPRG